ncbi:MAG: DUF1080 domain-containing protein, partial [Pedobacter sp.]|nr:DUF1080 domain-containing protein [Pedobacter sp.]
PYTVHNRTIEQITEGDLAILRFSEANGAGLAWIKNTEFTDGTIEFDARGRNVLQKSFLGIALHGKDNETYETIYLRPFNFQATDSTRRVHAVQYAFEPKFGFQQLRNTHKDQYESAILPANINPSDWFHVKVEVKADQSTVFLNGNKQPCLEVKSLNPNPSGKMIGFWVGNSSNGDFANFKLTKYKVSR